MGRVYSARQLALFRIFNVRHTCTLEDWEDWILEGLKELGYLVHLILGILAVLAALLIVLLFCIRVFTSLLRHVAKQETTSTFKIDLEFCHLLRMNREINYSAPKCCSSLEEFNFTGFLRPNCNPLLFIFNTAMRAWETRFSPQTTVCLEYNGERVTEETEVFLKNGDCFQVSYYPAFKAPVTVYYEQGRLYWSGNKTSKIMQEELIEKCETEVLRIVLKDTRKREESEAKFQAEIANLQGLLLKERSLKEKAMAKLKLEKEAAANKGIVEEARERQELEEVLPVEIINLQPSVQLQGEMQKERRPLDEQVGLNVDKKSIVEERPEEIANFQENLKIQQEMQESINLRRDSLRLNDVIPQINETVAQSQTSNPHCAVPLDLKEEQFVKTFFEMASIWKRERSQFIISIEKLNEEIEKLTLELHDQRGQDFVQKQQTIAAMAMLEKTLLTDKSEYGVLEGHVGLDEVMKQKEYRSGIQKSNISESDISILDNNICVMCESDLSLVDSVLEGFHRYCHNCANNVRGHARDS